MLRSHFVAWALILIFCFACSTAAQVETKVICKGAPVPQGYKIVGETVAGACPGRNGWLVEKDSRQPRPVITLRPVPTEPRAAPPIQKIPVRTGNGTCKVNGGIPLNSVEANVANIQFSVCLGKLSNGKCATMNLHEEQITEDIYTPYAFSLPDPDRGEVELINDTSLPPKKFGELHKLVDGTVVPTYSKQPMRQIKLPTELVDVVVLSHWEYDLRFYHAEDVGPKENGLYRPMGRPYVVWKFKNPEPPLLNRFQIIKTKDGVDDVTEFSYDEVEDRWDMLKNGALVTTKSSVVNPDDPCERIETRFDSESGELVKKIKIFRAFPWGQALVKVIEDPDGKALVTTYAYFEEKKEAHYTQLKSITHPDGTVELHNQQ